MQPTDLIRSFGHSAHLGYTQRRRVAEYKCIGLEDLIECGKQAQFLLHVLNHSLDHQVTVSKVFHVHRPM